MKKVNAVLIILGSVAVVFIVFALGVYVGYSKAIFASGRSDNYYQNFLGGMPGVSMDSADSGMPGSIHGIVGTIVEVASTSIIVCDKDDNEESVMLPQGTVVRMMDKTVDVTGFAVGESVAVIGDPTANGQIQARFVRIFPGSSTMPVPPEIVPMSNSSGVIIIKALSSTIF